MKVFRLVLVIVLAVIASILPAPALKADCEIVECYGQEDCDLLCGCLGFSWGLCVRGTHGYPGTCLCN